MVDFLEVKGYNVVEEFRRIHFVGFLTLGLSFESNIPHISSRFQPHVDSRGATMKRRLLWCISISLFSISIAFSGAPGTKKTATPQSLNKTAIQDWKFFDGNSIQCTISNDGPYCDYRKTLSAGLYWPKYSGKTAVYTAGIWIIGVHRPTGMLRTAVQDYSTEFQPGKILTTFNTTTNNKTVADDPTKSIYHIYKISKSDTVGGVNPDYDQWPASLGAPVDGKGKPFFWGDQELWCVYNDVDSNFHTSIGATKPLGIEVQATYFGFDPGGALENTMFVRWKIINKSDADYDSVFISLFSDTDLGGANDDFAGVDVGRGMEYMYNASNNDVVYGAKPPADGFVLLQGPRVKNSDSTAFFEGKKIKGFYNRQPTSHVLFLGGDPLYTDPPMGNYPFASTAYGYQNGLIGATNQPFNDPTTGSPTKFVCSGDPVTGTGWLMSSIKTGGGDVRSMMSSGPFALAKGDTQEIVGAFVIAQGSDRLSSVTLLKQTAEIARKAFESNFVVPTGIRVRSDVAGESATLNFSVDGSLLHAKEMVAKIKTSEGVEIAQVPLFDDGFHDDGVSGDGIFANSTTLATQKSGLVMDLLITDKASQTTLWPQVVRHIMTTSLQITVATIVSDNLNNDGKANPGENVRFVFTLSNPHSIGFGQISAWTPEEADAAGKSIPLNSLPAHGQYAIVYNPGDQNSYLDVNIPAGFTGNSFTVHLNFADSSSNVWHDTITVPIYQFKITNALMQHVAGTAEGEFSILITDPSAVKDHLYAIRGLDSIGTSGMIGFSLKDSTDGRVIYDALAIPDASGHTMTPVDGFKLFRGSIVADNVSGKSWEFSLPDSARWFGPDDLFLHVETHGTFVGNQLTYMGPFTSIYRGDVHRIQVRFSAKTSFDDSNGNGKYDLGELYHFDTLNTQRAQKAFFYTWRFPSITKYIGYKWVPFAVFDLDSKPVRQLNVIVRDMGLNNQWDLGSSDHSTSPDYVWILSDNYDLGGTAWDSSKGINLKPFPPSPPNLPIYWGLALDQRAAHEPYSSANDLILTPTYVFSTRDLYLFNPTVIMGVPGSAAPTNFVLEQNYPNPFNPSTTIRYSLEGKTKVRLRIYNVLGQVVSTLVDDEEIAGTHTILWNGTSSFGVNVSTGIYFYRIEAGNFVQTKKMILLK